MRSPQQSAEISLDFDTQELLALPQMHSFNAIDDINAPDPWLHIAMHAANTHTMEMEEEVEIELTAQEMAVGS